MTALFSLTLAEARGAVAPPSNLDSAAVVMGVASGAAGITPFYLSSTSAISALGYGDAVDSLCQMVEQRSSNGSAVKKPVAFYSTAATTPGYYGSLDSGDFTGLATATVDSTSHPFGTYEARLRFPTGGIVGAAGIVLQWSLDAGRTWSRYIALGTAATYTIPGSNAKFDFAPATSALTSLNTLINEEFTDVNAHIVLTTGTVHSNADSPTMSAGTYPSATNTATRVARINAIVSTLIAHFGKGSGASPAIHINLGGDAANAAALTSVPVATDDVTALQAALVVKDILNAHVGSTIFHTIADATNTVTSPTPTAGSINAGDELRVRTFAPAPDANDLADAIEDLAVNGPNFRVLVIDMPMTAALLVTVTSGLNRLRDVGKRVFCIVRSRLPNFEAVESETAWGASVTADFDGYEDSRIHVVTAYGLLTDAGSRPTRVYLRSFLGQVGADVIRVSRSTWFDSPDDRISGMENTSLVYANGLMVGHDEGPRGTFTGMSDEEQGNRLGCVQRLSDQSVVQTVYPTYPWVLFGAGENVKTVMARRTANAMESTVLTVMIRVLGSKIYYNAPDPNVPGSLPTLLQVSRDTLHSLAFSSLTSEFSDDIQNAGDGDTDTGLVQVSPYVTIANGKATASIYLSVRMFGYLVGLNITYAAKE